MEQPSELNKECKELLNKYYDKIDYDDFAEYNSENGICKNKTTLSNIPIGLFNEKGLLKMKDGNDTWCYTYDEIGNTLIGKRDLFNIYTLKKFDRTKFIEDNKELLNNHNYSTTQFDILIKQKLFNRMCPTFYSKEGEYFFEYDKDSLTVNEYNELRKKNSLFFEPVTSSIGPDLRNIYKVTYNNENDFKNNVNLKSLKLVYNTWDDDTVRPEKTGLKIKNPKLEEELKYFFGKGGRTIKNINALVKLNIRPSKPIKVYRGLHFEFSNKLPEHVKNPFIGKKITLEDTRAQSWTTNLCIALAFATNYDYGVVYSTILNPEDIIIDTRQLERSYLKSLYFQRQNEIIAKPGKKEVTVELITNMTEWTAKQWIDRNLLKETSKYKYSIFDEYF